VDELREARREELLEAAIDFWCGHYEVTEDDFTHHEIRRFMQLGFNIAQVDGWQHVAPKWLHDYWEHIEIPF
jgi:hypothetical protein